MTMSRRFRGLLLGVFLPVGALLPLAGPVAAQGVLVDRSEIRFTSRQMGVNFEGRFRKWTANVVFDPVALLKSRVDFEIDLGSIDLASRESETEARGPLWFDTARFPVAHFVSTAISKLDADHYDVSGRLSLKGLTRDCVVPIAITRDAAGNRVAQGSFSLKRLDYRIGEGEWADPETVANDVVVRIRMVLPPAA
jgi:polyisoprenoid-binding protein YceI